MLFVTVGAHTPFDRLVRTVDRWAEVNARSDVFAQIGSTSWTPQHIRWTNFLDPAEFRCKCSECSLMIGHAGTGTIITALQLKKPLVIMPRKESLRETRNDHQLATLRRFCGFPTIHGAENEQELHWSLNQSNDLIAAANDSEISDYASDELLGAISDFINL